ncbi:hypothetical protein ACNKHM_00960 [Shigella sonnei]
MKKLPEDTLVTAQTSIGDNGEIVESTCAITRLPKSRRLVTRGKVKDAKKTTENACCGGECRSNVEYGRYQLPANE